MGFFDAYTSSSDFRMAYAEAAISQDYGKTASFEAKSKGLDKFGQNLSLDTADGRVVVSSLGVNETLATTNAHTHIVGGSGDTIDVLIEGHYVDASGNLIFHIQTQTLTAATPVALDQPLARVSRMKALGSSVPTGPIQATTGSGGTAICQILAGDTQSQKCATAVSYRDYLAITQFGGAVLTSNNGAVTFRIEQRPVGGVWYPLTRDFVLGNQGRAEFTLDVPLIIPPNSDVRITASSTANSTQVTAHFAGYFAIDLELADAADPTPA